ncbi:MAG: DUF2551 domain-containing protein [Methanotrichaceae archaeon]|nr:DUF2551 domain-containing protein [Methanotrichaceae archaeon]
MKPSEPEIRKRLIRFLDQDQDGLRKFVIQQILEAGEITVASLHCSVKERFAVSRRVVASLIGYICSSLGLLRAHRSSYRSPIVYVLREEYAEIARYAVSGALSKA